MTFFSKTLVGYCYICYAAWDTSTGGTSTGSFGLSISDADNDNADSGTSCTTDYISVSYKLVG